MLVPISSSGVCRVACRFGGMTPAPAEWRTPFQYRFRNPEERTDRGSPTPLSRFRIAGTSFVNDELRDAKLKLLFAAFATIPWSFADGQQ